MPRKAEKKAKKKARKKVEKAIGVIEHQDKRLNIPTGELASFVAEDEASPSTLLYPRDLSLDPQLVWKGKDEQDRQDLAVPVVPIYIQEKIHPLALIENLRDTASSGEPEPEQLLFHHFDGPDPLEAKLDFYQHEGNWANRMILGDSLFVMTSLAEKEGLRGKVQMIYVDPPYGIKFGSNWQVSTRKRDVRDGKAKDTAREPEVVKAFRDTWQLGIHSYLSYLRDRLTAARELLTETGSIFVQIGDENVHLVRSVLDEVFGSENFVVQVQFATTGGLATQYLSRSGDLLLWYGKSRERLKYRPLFLAKEPRASGGWGYNYLEDPEGIRRPLTTEERQGLAEVPQNSRVYRLDNLLSQGSSVRGENLLRFEGQSYAPNPNSHWKTHPEGLKRLVKARRVQSATRQVAYVRFFHDFALQPLDNNWDDATQAGFVESKAFVVQTVSKVVERCLLMTTDPGDLVLDPTCGSGTTGFVAEQWGRRWITIDTSRVALALARTRLMTAKFPYHVLLDSTEGFAKEVKITGQIGAPDASSKFGHDVRKGFVYRRVPHITLKHIANNEEVDEVHARFEKELEPLRAKLNDLLRASWEEWEVPRDTTDEWSGEAREAHARYLELRRERQQEIDASIARRADRELLVDQPYQDSGTVRVTGPFTVESLAPHRVLSTEEERPTSEQEGERDSGSDFVGMILENLRKAGVQNTRRKERLKFDRLEPFAGRWLQAAGEFQDAEGETRRVAISIGSEHGAVGQQQIQEAAKEAVQGLGFDLLLVLGFAFDPHASETVEAISPPGECEGGFVAERQRQFGKLPVLLVRMNPDLSMGDALLKKTGAGNLFMVFGDPDIEIRPLDDDKLEVEIRGLDIYDPTTGEIRSSSTDDIACWFLDTAYDGESFFVRHAYFTGADEPYEKLKRALRAEIDPGAWSSLYRTVSRPFDRPKTGRIAVKVINHYGDEVLKVYEVD
jgi:adenine-specific DNA-methyltransferase